MLTPSLQRLLVQQADELIELFIHEGPEALQDYLEIREEKAFREVYDYLVFGRNMLQECVERFPEFFRVLIQKQGAKSLRKIFAIEEKKYNPVYAEILDIMHRSTAHRAIASQEQLHRKFLSRIFSGLRFTFRSGLPL